MEIVCIMVTEIINAKRSNWEFTENWKFLDNFAVFSISVNPSATNVG